MSLKKNYVNKKLYAFLLYQDIFSNLLLEILLWSYIRFLCKFEKNVLYNVYNDPIQEKASALQLHTKSIKNDIKN